MRSITHFVRYEFRRFKGVPRLALLFVLLLPLLYGVIYLGANWNLYDNIDEIKVAVVNNDKPTKFEGMEIDGGGQFVEALRDRPVFDWQFLDSEEEAREGLREGEYYMVITVPENFSSNLVSAGNYDPKRAVITMHRDDANGFIIGSLTGKAEDTLAKTLDSTVSDAYFRALFGSLEEIRQGMLDAADGAGQLDDGLAQVKDGVAEMHEKLLQASSKTEGLVDTANAVEKGLDGVSASVDEVSKGAAQMRSGASTVADSGAAVAGSIQAAAAQVDPLINHALGQLPKIREQAGELVKVQGEINSDGGGLVVDLNRHVDRARTHSSSLSAKYPELAKDKDFIALTRELDGARNSHVTLTSKLDQAATLTAGINLQLDTSGLEKAARNAQSSLDNARKQAGGIDNGVAAMRAGAGTVDQGLQDGRDALRSVGAQARSVTDSIPEVVDGVVRLTDGVGKLNTAVPQLSDGAHKLRTGLDDGARRLPQLSDSEQENLAVVMSSPVDLEQVVDHDAENYGRGLAPLFASIGLWILCISGFLVVRTISGRALTGRGNPLRLAATGLGPIAAIGLVASWLTGFGLWFFLGLNPVHPVLFFLLLTVSSLSFLSLAYMFRVIMGSPQTALFLVWLIIQIPSSGGTFPVQMLPPLFQYLAPVSPMWYTVTAFRVTISGGSMATYWMCIGVLAGVLALAVTASVLLIRRRQRFRMRDLHPPMITSESTADYAFSIRPR